MESWLWTQKQDIGPSPRFGSSMAYDSSLKRIILFGGGLDWNITKNDTWEWKDNTWTQIADSGPSPRVHYAMEYDSSRKWDWDGSNWTQRQNMGPSSRSGYSMAYDSERKRVVLFGGAGSSGYLGDTWELKILTIPE